MPQVKTENTPARPPRPPGIENADPEALKIAHELYGHLEYLPAKLRYKVVDAMHDLAGEEIRCQGLARLAEIKAQDKSRGAK
jgi:hypothetical protein